MPFYRSFFWGRVPLRKIDHRKKGTLILTSPLEDLDELQLIQDLIQLKKRTPTDEEDVQENNLHQIRHELSSIGPSKGNLKEGTRY